MKTLAEVLAEERKRQDEREEAAVRRMTGLYENLNAEIANRLRVLDSTIADAIANGEIVKPTWLHQQARYRVLQQDVTALVDLYATEGDRAIRDARMAEIRAGRWDAAERVDARTPDVNMLNAGVNHQAVENMAAQLSRESPVHTVLADMAGQYTEAIEQSLISGIANGRGVDAILRDVMQATAGVMSPQRVRTIIRTEAMRAYNTALVDQYDEIPEVAAFEWTAARGSRTCLACLALDGERFVSRDDIPGRHANCRCTISPVPVNEYQSVKDYFAQRGSSEDWLRKQPPAAIRKHFPSQAAYDAFMAGDLHLSDFVGETHSKVWGTSIRQKSGREALEDLELRRNAPPKAPQMHVSTIPENGFYNRKDAADWFTENNIAATYDDDTYTWEMTEAARGFERELRAGAPLPDRIDFQRMPPWYENHVAHYDPRTRSIVINTSNFNKASMDAEALANTGQGSRWVVGTDPQSVITHELAHFRHDGISLPSALTAPQQKLAGNISQYAMTDADEFIAETYTAIRNGENVPTKVLKLYDELGGIRP